MQDLLLSYLRCPVSRSPLTLQVLSRASKNYNDISEPVILDGILFAAEDWFYPIINGIPRMIVEAFIDYEDFFRKHLPDYNNRRLVLEKKYHGLLKYVDKKNRRTKKSFELEWGIYDYSRDKTWDLDPDGMLERFFSETAETKDSLKNKIILDAGCGNGLLNQYIARTEAIIIGMDFSLSVIRAYETNTEKNALFIQGDIQFPPFMFKSFDIVHSSGVLICTNNTELSFSCIEPCVKDGGKLSVWLYHPRKDFIHNLFNEIRNFTSRWPIRFQYYLYLITIFPVSFIIKRIKGNRQNKREMMIDIMDWFSPEFRWEHEPDEATSWFFKRKYKNIRATTTDLFGFNIIGTKESET